MIDSNEANALEIEERTARMKIYVADIAKPVPNIHLFTIPKEIQNDIEVRKLFEKYNKLQSSSEPEFVTLRAYYDAIAYALACKYSNYIIREQKSKTITRRNK
jgi:hypothetical protein